MVKIRLIDAKTSLVMDRYAGAPPAWGETVIIKTEIQDTTLQVDVIMAKAET